MDRALSGYGYPKSVAEQRRVWMGGLGRFQKADIISWFRAFNSTAIQDTTSYFTKSNRQYAKKAQIYKFLGRQDKKKAAQMERNAEVELDMLLN